VRLAGLIDWGRFEAAFGVKLSLAATNALAPGGQFVLGARALPGNPYDGHTLAAQIAQTERSTGVEIERAYVDRGYRGHDADRARVILAGQKRGVTPTIRRERRRRNAIEPVIGHMKSDGHLGRNFQPGTEGDAANLLICRRRPQPPPAPRLAGLALGVPDPPAGGCAPSRSSPFAATHQRLKTAFFTGDSIPLTYGDGRPDRAGDPLERGQPADRLQPQVNGIALTHCRQSLGGSQPVDVGQLWGRRGIVINAQADPAGDAALLWATQMDGLRILR
jgi:IS5 family transposase